jgi:hypothetical protein
MTSSNYFQRPPYNFYLHRHPYAKTCYSGPLTTVVENPETSLSRWGKIHFSFLQEAEYDFKE